MRKLLDQKVALVTGSASGIGLQIARTFAGEGSTVVISDINQDAAEESALQLKSEGCQAYAMRLDVTEEEQMKSVLENIIDRFGRLDVLVNNAGLQFVSPLEQFPTETFEKMIKIMLTAPFIATKLAFPIMKLQASGRIINMASINGLVGFAGKAAYNSAKHGVIGLTKVAALEGAPFGITVNALCPGYVNTALVQNQLQDLADTRHVPLDRVLEDVIFPMVPQKRLLSVQEVADYAVFLASDKAKGITGQAVVLDGGYTVQ